MFQRKEMNLLLYTNYSASLVLIYNTAVNCTKLTALYFLLLDCLQRYTDMQRMCVWFRKSYSERISIKGLRSRLVLHRMDIRLRFDRLVAYFFEGFFKNKSRIIAC